MVDSRGQDGGYSEPRYYGGMRTHYNYVDNEGNTVRVDRNKAYRREQKYKTTPSEVVLLGAVAFAVASPFLVMGAIGYATIHFVAKFW